MERKRKQFCVEVPPTVSASSDFFFVSSSFVFGRLLSSVPAYQLAVYIHNIALVIGVQNFVLLAV